MKQCPKGQTTLQNNRSGRFCSKYSWILMAEWFVRRQKATAWMQSVTMLGPNYLSWRNGHLACFKVDSISCRCSPGCLLNWVRLTTKVANACMGFHRFVVGLTSSSTEQSVSPCVEPQDVLLPSFQEPAKRFVPNHVEQVHTLISYCRQDAY